MEVITLEGVCPVCEKSFFVSFFPEAGNVLSINGRRETAARKKIWGDMETHMIMHDENEYLTEQDTWR